MNTSDGSSRLLYVTSIAHTSPPPATTPITDQESKEDNKTNIRPTTAGKIRRYAYGRKLLGRRMGDLCQFLLGLRVPAF
jgi:hypothetical protein